jgi:hypothetical protein
MSFDCLFPYYHDAYGRPSNVGVMIYDMITGKCWVDGSSYIPDNGCENYRKYNKVNNKVVENLI